MIEVQVKDLSRGGAGVSKDPGGKVVFIPYTVPGDVVSVEIVQENKHYAQGELIEILKPSPDRVSPPPCPVFGKCGGCEWQHVPYSLQWETKVKGVMHALKRVNVALPLIIEEFPAQKVWEYRNRIQLRGFRDQIGFYASKSHDLVSIDKCFIAHPLINFNLCKIKADGSKLEKFYKVEVTVTNTQQEVLQTIWNAPHGALGFRQINFEQNEKLKHWIAENLTPNNVRSLKHNVVLYDLYGGNGNLSLDLISNFKQIYCVDTHIPSEEEIETLCVSGNYQFCKSSVLSWLIRQRKKNMLSAHGSAILDPPREGLGSEFREIVLALDELKVNEVIIVGCDVDAFVRDISKFIKRDWKLKKIAIFDFFPQTHHVESVALMEK
ncbi:MAG: class I SAM-dependent RNA methyltransferase [Bdellovibrio sp.]|nr:class I SAM-dependent RNA methyltransferase [Bdellovibrio sp.]